MASPNSLNYSSGIVSICLYFCYWYLYHLVAFPILVCISMKYFDDGTDEKYFCDGHIYSGNIELGVIINGFECMCGVFPSIVFSTCFTLIYQIAFGGSGMSYIIAFVPVIVLVGCVLLCSDCNCCFITSYEMCPLLCPDWCGCVKTICCCTCTTCGYSDPIHTTMYYDVNAYHHQIIGYDLI
ncbi:hypothetical protein EIN_287140 [Entamoeba invadens IP1]|uniref:Uncharacterized protein n=1 Tax=Entamoeba invadens IP1 TaxID=370355 RepID=A0A0A1U4W7_ENTIV|nr:hypothetical protein EIN_287140 [Entamoeba invadens IP1]ELP89338.1 hypothetical protein EIN_287140 [Entamoeba invadens IP1]|eukprot:XP_004256109.1 hypothetical protein EIN_287140 [Entamoeba invadens IP1]